MKGVHASLSTDDHLEYVNQMHPTIYPSRIGYSTLRLCLMLKNSIPPNYSFRNSSTNQKLKYDKHVADGSKSASENVNHSVFSHETAESELYMNSSLYQQACSLVQHSDGGVASNHIRENYCLHLKRNSRIVADLGRYYGYPFKKQQTGKASFYELYGKDTPNIHMCDVSNDDIRLYSVAGNAIQSRRQLHTLSGRHMSDASQLLTDKKALRLDAIMFYLKQVSLRCNSYL